MARPRSKPTERMAIDGKASNRRISSYSMPCFNEWSQSTQQSFYYIQSLSVDGTQCGWNLDCTDIWMAAFSPSGILVGAKQWTTDYMTDIPVMGDDNFNNCIGCMNSGDIPIFKLYDPAINMYYDAILNPSTPWNDFGTFPGLTLTGTGTAKSCDDIIDEETTHEHLFGDEVQQHWGEYPGGTTNAPWGYTHTHDMSSRGHKVTRQRGGRVNSNSRFSGRSQTNPKGKPTKR